MFGPESPPPWDSAREYTPADVEVSDSVLLSVGTGFACIANYMFISLKKHMQV